MQGFGEWLATLDWGDVPSWVGGIGTTAAVIVALWQSGRETRRRRRDDEQVQARLVSGWESYDPRPEFEDQIRFFLSNLSELPIYDFVICSTWGSDKYHNGEHEESLEMINSMFYPILPPGKYMVDYRMGGPAGRQHAPYISFKDAAGNFWTRHEDGFLEKITKEDPLVTSCKDDLMTQSPLLIC